MADAFARLVSQANPAASQYRPTYPPTNANSGLDPFFDDDDDPEPGTSTPRQINSNNLRGPPDNLLSPEGASDPFHSVHAMQSTDSGLPLTTNAAPPAGSSHVWGFDDDDVQLPNTFGGSASFPGNTSHPSIHKSERKSGRPRKWRWPWQKEVQREGDRVIALNDEQANRAEAHCSNYVSTSKYNLATFLPKFLAGMPSSSSYSSPFQLSLTEQFSKYANIFFLFTACIQQIPGVSPTNQYTTIVPLGLVLSASAFKEVSEDLKRHQSDKELNARRAKARLPPFRFQSILTLCSGS